MHWDSHSYRLLMVVVRMRGLLTHHRRARASVGGMGEMVLVLVLVLEMMSDPILRVVSETALRG